MSTVTPAAPTTRPHPRPVFPDSDGQPMADNTIQFDWISTIKWNLEHLFAADPDVFVAGDNLVYPNPDDPADGQAPDVYVAFGRPKGYRGSYKVWEEGGVFPQVVFEVWSPNNTWPEMERKREWYGRHGAEEFYVIYPYKEEFAHGYWREGDTLRHVRETNGFVSPRLGVRFHVLRDKLTLYGPDGRPFRNPAEIAAERDRAEQAEREAAARAEEEARQKAAERQRAEQEKQRADAERQRAEREKQRADKLAAKLRELGVDPDA